MFKSVNRKLLLVVVFTVIWMLGMMIVVYFTYLHKTPVRIENWTPPPAADGSLSYPSRTGFCNLAPQETQA